MITVDHLGGGDSLLVRPDGNGCAMSVAARHHQHSISLESVVASEDVGGQVASGDMAQVKRAIGIGPSYGDENALSHGTNPYRLKARSMGNSELPGHLKDLILA